MPKSKKKSQTTPHTTYITNIYLIFPPLVRLVPVTRCHFRCRFGAKYSVISDGAFRNTHVILRGITVYDMAAIEG